MAVRLVLIDDHDLFRDGMKALLELGPRYQVVGDVGDARSGMAAAARLQPDLITLDVGLPGTNGIAAIDDIRRAAPEARILMLTAHAAHEFVLQAFANGAHGYATKD